MNASTAFRPALAFGLLFASLTAQEWNDEQLAAASEGFQVETLPARLEQIVKLLASRQQAYPALVARIHGDHLEYGLRIQRLLGELGDARWQVREAAERTLIEIGAGAIPEIQTKKEKYDVLEQQIRCARILEKLAEKGHEQEDRKKRLLRGLVATTLYLDPEPRLLRALRSALGEINVTIADAAARALGKLGGDEEAGALVHRVRTSSASTRLTAIAALTRMQSPKALAFVKELVAGNAGGELLLTRTELMTVMRVLHARDDEAAKAWRRELASHTDPLVAAAAAVTLPPAKEAPKATFQLAERLASQGPLTMEGTFERFLGDSYIVANAFPDLPRVELSLSDCDTIDFPAHAQGATPAGGSRVFLNQGSLVSGEVLAIDGEQVKLRSRWFGEHSVPRKDVQGIAFDITLDRLVGGSLAYDRVKLRTGSFLDGNVLRADASTLVHRPEGGQEQNVPLAEVAGVLMTRPKPGDPDTTSYARFDLANGERLIGFVVGCTSEHVAVAVPLLGAAVVPWRDVVHAELSVGGGALWGFTLIADYSENRIVEVDDQGRVVFELQEAYGAWDAECLDNNNLLITEFSVSRVREVDRKGNEVWVFEDLKNPYDADRLPNGNTLIADTFGSRVIEVTKDGQIAWSFAKEVRPFDCDRLPNGNTLIADVLKDRVIEVDRAGEIVWEVKGLPTPHDADRLPNGNTLVTLRNKGQVVEIDRDGKVVFELTGLNSPSDADRLPNGNTIVAENSKAREFDRRGNQVWQQEMTWAVEVNRY